MMMMIDWISREKIWLMMEQKEDGIINAQDWIFTDNEPL